MGEVTGEKADLNAKFAFFVNPDGLKVLNKEKTETGEGGEFAIFRTSEFGEEEKSRVSKLTKEAQLFASGGWSVTANKTAPKS